jgi:membrane-anchored protein YejM (alkaline phosphatase superfamily)
MIKSVLDTRLDQPLEMPKPGWAHKSGNNLFDCRQQRDWVVRSENARKMIRNFLFFWNNEDFPAERTNKTHCKRNGPPRTLNSVADAFHRLELKPGRE